MLVEDQGDGSDSGHDECEQEADLMQLTVCFKSSGLRRHIGLEQPCELTHHLGYGPDHQNQPSALKLGAIK